MKLLLDHWPMLLVIGVILTWAAIVARVCAISGRCRRGKSGQ